MTALQHHVKTTFSAKRSHCSDVRALIESTLAPLNPSLSKDLLHNIILATDELFTNTVKHAYQEDASKTIGLEIQVSSLNIAVIIEHTGTPFDPSTYTPFDPNATLDQRRTGGMGVFIMEHLADQVAFERSKSGAHRAILHFHRKHPTS